MTTKVFVGNLALQTTDQSLAEAFSKICQVKSGVIITRGRRSLGYGFVDFASPEDANQAVNQMNQTEFLNRTIKVELVRDPPPRPPRQAGGPSGEGRPVNNNNNNTVDNVNDDNLESGAAKRRTRRPRRRPRRNDNQGGQGQGQGESPVGRAPVHQNDRNVDYAPRSENTGGDPPPPRRSRQRRPRKQNNTDAAPKEKIQSKTAVFVANLPFSVDDKALTEIFTGFNVKTAHVVTTRTGRSRGYGFVDFGTEDDQKKAIAGKHETEVIGSNGKARDISVTVSHSVAQPPEESGAENK